MSDILSTAELDALIDAFREPSDTEEGTNVGKVMVHVPDPRTEVHLNDAQLAALKTIHGSFAWAAESALGDLIGPDARIKLAWQVQMDYSDYLLRLENSLVANVAAPPLKGRVTLEFSHALAQALLDAYYRRSLGMTNRSDFNEVEMSLLREVAEGVMTAYAEPWHQLAKLKPQIKSFEPCSAKSQVAMPGDPVLVAALEVQIGVRTEFLTICLPNSVLKPFLAGLASPAADRSSRRSSYLEVSHGVAASAEVNVEGWKDQDIAVGTMVELREYDVDLLHEGNVVGRGEFVVIEGAIAVRVLEVGAKKRRTPRRTRAA